eukprot:107658-Chlamydomonas_euryale.AAC.15
MNTETTKREQGSKRAGEHASRGLQQKTQRWQHAREGGKQKTCGGKSGRPRRERECEQARTCTSKQRRAELVDCGATS